MKSCKEIFIARTEIPSVEKVLERQLPIRSSVEFAILNNFLKDFAKQAYVASIKVSSSTSASATFTGCVSST